MSRLHTLKEPTKFYLRLFIIVGWLGFVFGGLWLTSISRISKKEAHTIHILGWPEPFRPETIREFEKETGIRIKTHYYMTNEECLIKLKETKRYDLMVLSDYVVQIIDKRSHLKPLDRSQIDFLATLNPILLERDYDPKNEYCLPYQWEVFAFGIDSNYFQTRPFEANWNQVFDTERIDYKIAMINDPIEVINVATHYLYGSDRNHNTQKSQRIYNLLRKQKKWIELYAEPRTDHCLIAENCQLALGSSSYLLRASRHHPHIACVIPKDWNFISIDNVCLAKESDKGHLVYRFLNYLYQPEVLARESNDFHSFPATTNTLAHLDVSEEFKDYLQNLHEWETHLFPVRPFMSEREMRSLWVKVKS